MKKLICLLVVALMVLTTTFSYAETDTGLMLERLMTLTDHAGKMNAWKEELNSWFNEYKARIGNGETLSLDEMNVIFTYVDLAVDMTYIFLAETALLGETESNSTDADLRETADSIRMFYEKGLITQEKYIESISPIFENLVSK